MKTITFNYNISGINKFIIKNNNINTLFPNSFVPKRSLSSKSTQEIRTRDLKEFRSFFSFISFTLPLLFTGQTHVINVRLSHIKHVYLTKGPRYTLKYLKATKSQLEWLLFQGSQGAAPEHLGVSIGLDSDKWPKWLGVRLKSKCLLATDAKSIRLVFTLTSVTTMITVPNYTNLHSIINKQEYEPDFTSVFRINIQKTAGLKLKSLKKHLRKPEIGTDIDDVYIKSRVSNSGKGFDYRVKSTEFPPQLWTMKSGPNGASMFAWPYDRAAIWKYGMNDLINYCKSYYSGDSQQYITNKVVPYSPLFTDSIRMKEKENVKTIKQEKSQLKKTLNMGKISLLQEPGKLKPRIFAIVTSLYQTILEPLHQDLMNMLKDIDEDCTYDQNNISTVAKEKWDSGLRFYGYADLSNASDAIPVFIYEEVGNIISNQLGTRWVNLFTLPFVVSDSVKSMWNGSNGEACPREVIYGTGQPMGALSSWPFMALVHHVLVWKAFGSYTKAKSNYRILGDDVVIFDKTAYLNYLDILNSLKISYTNNISTVGFEFAKRFFINGMEVTGAYTAALYEQRHDAVLFAYQWINLQSRGYITTSGVLTTQLFSFLKFNQKNIKLVNKLLEIPIKEAEGPTRKERLKRFYSYLTIQSLCNHSNNLSKTLPKGHYGPEASHEHKQYMTDLFIQFELKRFFALFVRTQINKMLSEAKENNSFNIDNYETFLGTKQPELIVHWPEVFRLSIVEYHESTKLNQRMLEKSLKEYYTSDRADIWQVLRPTFPEMPFRIDYSQNRDAYLRRVKIQGLYQLSLINAFR